MVKHSYRSSAATLERWFIPIKNTSTWGPRTYFYMKLWPDETNPRVLASIKDNKQQMYMIRAELKEANERWIKQVNPKMSDDMVKIVVKSLENYLSKGEYQLYSTLALNEFLNQDEITVYRDFLENNHEKISGFVEALTFPQYSHSKNVIEHLSESKHILQLRPGAKNDLKDSVEFLTLDQIKTLLKEPIKELLTQPGTVPKVIAAKLAKQRGEVERLPGTAQIYNTFFLAFSKGLAKESSSAGYRFDKLSTLVVEYLNDFMKDVYTKSEHSQLGQISSAQALALSNYFLDIAEELTPRELFAVLAGLGTPGIFSRGNRATSREFLIKATALPREESIDFFKSLSQVIISYEESLPSAQQWLSALENDELVLGDGIMMAAIVSGGEVNDYRPIYAQQSFRRQLNVHCAN